MKVASLYTYQSRLPGTRRGERVELRQRKELERVGTPSIVTNTKDDLDGGPARLVGACVPHPKRKRINTSTLEESILESVPDNPHYNNRLGFPNSARIRSEGNVPSRTVARSATRS